MSQSPVRKRERSHITVRCCRWGALTAGGMLLILLSLMSYAGHQMLLDAVHTYTAATPIQLFPEEPREGELHLDQKAHSLSFSPQALNRLFREASPPDTPPPFFVQRIEKEGLWGRLSLPLAPLGLGERYLNGAAQCTLTCDAGKLALHLHQVWVEGEALPPAFLQQVAQCNLLTQAVAALGPVAYVEHCPGELCFHRITVVAEDAI